MKKTAKAEQPDVIEACDLIRRQLCKLEMLSAAICESHGMFQYEHAADGAVYLISDAVDTIETQLSVIESCKGSIDLTLRQGYVMKCALGCTADELADALNEAKSVEAE